MGLPTTEQHPDRTCMRVCGETHDPRASTPTCLCSRKLFNACLHDHASVSHAMAHHRGLLARSGGASTEDGDFMKRMAMTARLVDSNPHMTDMPSGSTHWRCTLRYERRRLTVPFSMGPALSREPTSQDVLGCLLSDASGADAPFEEWARDLGFDPDSRKAERTYKIVVKQTADLHRLLGNDFDAWAKWVEAW